MTLSPSSPPADSPVATGGGAMTVAEFCKWSRLGRTAVYREIKCGRLKLRKAGGKSLILVADAEAWLRALPTVA